ncbi:hypothetical protein [Sphingomonas cavernae]|uniref:hypothetical protein n=1 Tax=Sphingomonas cavernae TaxID=2320861 RepID=UPI0015FF8F90|nr:hypothetical protein [Sphingomonas cavernae]
MGYSQEAQPLLIRGNQRIDQGLAAKEYEWFGSVPAQHQHNLHQARALGAWLEDGLLASTHWSESRRFLEAWWRSEKNPWTRQEIIRDGLDDYMALAALGGEAVDSKGGFDPYRAGVDMYEHWLGEPKISLGKALKPRELGYVLCRHYLNFEFNRDEVLDAGRRMLTAHLESDWLENGQTLRAAMWLMLVHWYPAFYYDEELPSPIDVLLKVYEDMPHVARPF